MIVNWRRLPPITLEPSCARYFVDVDGALVVVAAFGSLKVVGYSRSDGSPGSFIEECLAELKRAVAFAQGAGR